MVPNNSPLLQVRRVTLVGFLEQRNDRGKELRVLFDEVDEDRGVDADGAVAIRSPPLFLHF